mmetsp:Transcript_37111/g.83129  ORF Transcript_37111/g.83129 Transcript_37111/m.83129 type:complete len:352 (-) Transcript_37111:357-1412(-)
MPWEGCLASGRSSSSSSRVRASPNAFITSAKPCAAPDRSTEPGAVLSVSTSHGNTSEACAGPRPATIWPRALAAVCRTSGMGSTTPSSRPGSSDGTYGSMSFGSEIMEHMFPAMRPALRFTSELGAFMPRWRTGTSRASEGASIAWMNSQTNKASTAALVCFEGSVKALRSLSLSEATSGFRTTDRTSRRLCFPASRTLGCVSLKAAVSLGMIWGRQVPRAFGAQWAMAPSNWIAACFVRQASSSRASRILGRTSLTPCWERWPMMVRAVEAAASRTCEEPSEKALSSSGSTTTTYGSNKSLSRAQRSSMQNSAPCLAGGLPVVQAFSKVATTLRCLRLPIPRPFTTAETP